LSTTTRILFRGKYHDLEEEYIQDIKYFQSEGETLEQTLERVIVEALEERRLARLKNAGTLDYYLSQ
jgi:hypothetical protein